MAAGTRWRVTAWGLALLWLLTPALAAVHSAIVTHVYCAEHGAFEHAEVPHGDDLPGDSITGGERADLSGAHELCGFSDCLLRTAVEADAPVIALAVASPDPLVTVVAHGDDAHVLPVLAVAPKASPPRA